MMLAGEKGAHVTSALFLCATDLVYRQKKKKQISLLNTTC